MITSALPGVEQSWTRVVAVKLLPQSLMDNEPLRARFKDEAAIRAHLEEHFSLSALA